MTMGFYSQLPLFLLSLSFSSFDSNYSILLLLIILYMAYIHVLGYRVNRMSSMIISFSVR